MDNPLAQTLHDSASTLTSATSETTKPMEPVDVAAHGTSGQGDVSVSVRNGKLTECTITESALTLDATAIGELVCAAANAALTEYNTTLVQALQAQQDTNMAALQRQIQELSQDADRNLTRYLEQIQSTLDKGAARRQHRVN